MTSAAAFIGISIALIHVQADSGRTLREAHNPGGRVRSALRATSMVIDATVHREPFENG
jgi:hypothetical protein